MNYLAILTILLPLTDVTFDIQPVPEVSAAITQWQSDSNSPTSWWIWGVTAFDQNGDGNQDLILTTHQSTPKTGSLILHGDGTGKFSPAQLGLTSPQLPHEYRPVILDINNDQKPDLLHSTQGTGHIIINQGTHLELSGTIQDLMSKGGGHSSDVNADTFPDWRQYPKDYGITSVTTFYNNTKGGFASITIPQPYPSLPADITLKLDTLQNVGRGDSTHRNRYCGPRFFPADLNSDGTSDWIVQYAGSYATTPAGQPYRFGWYSVPTGIPTNLVPLGISTKDGMKILDITGDNKPDIFCGYGPEAGLYIQGANGFTLSPNTDIQTLLRTDRAAYLPEIYTFDFDRDGDEDLLITMMRFGYLEVYDNRGNGIFTKLFRAYHWDAEGWAVADFNNDSMLDIAVGGPGPIKPASWPNTKNTNFTLYLNATSHPEPAEPIEPEPEPSPSFSLRLNGQPLPAGFELLDLRVVYKLDGKVIIYGSTFDQDELWQRFIKADDDNAP